MDSEGGWNLMRRGRIRGGGWVRTNMEKSCKNGRFIHKTPPFRIVKCLHQSPNNCDYLVNLIYPPIPVGKQEIDFNSYNSYLNIGK